MQPTSTVKNIKNYNICVVFPDLCLLSVGVLYQSQLIPQETSDHVEGNYDNSSETGIADEN